MTKAIHMLRQLVFVYRTRGLSSCIRIIYRELVRSILEKLCGIRWVRAKIFNFHLLLDLKDRGICRTLWLFGERELDHKWIMDRTVKHGSRILDIGANIGYYVLIEANLVGSSGQIVAVEPSPTNIDLLRKNIQLNGLDQVTVVEGAVSNSGGIQKFFLAEESNLNTFHRNILEVRNNLKGELDVQVLTVRELTKLYGSFDYIRMDIEGHEVQVLDDIVAMSNEGCRKLPDIIFETHVNAYGGDQDIGEVLHEIEKIGYQIAFVATSSERGTKLLEQYGSLPKKVIRTDEVYRSIHNDIQFCQLISCLEETGGVRTVYLTCRSEISLTS